MKKILGYCDDWSRRAGDRIAFKISTYGPKTYEAALVRVICGDAEPDHGIFEEEEIDAPFNGTYAGHEQAIDVGSYAVVPWKDQSDRLTSFTVQAWVFPTTPVKGEQIILAQWRPDPATGFALMLNAFGALTLRLGNGHGQISEISCRDSLAERRWYLVSGRFDASTCQAVVTHTPVDQSLEALSEGHAQGTASFAQASEAIYFAALPKTISDGRTGSSRHFNGKIDRPRLSSRALSPEEILSLGTDGSPGQEDGGLLAAWDFSHAIGTVDIRDIGPNALHGRTVNLPSRGCKGFNWSGREQSFRHAPQEYGAIHFHDDDLYDAGWETSFTYDIPKNLKSGAYAVRLRAEGDESYVTFFVRPKQGQPTAKLAFLASTVTYMAYANYHWLFHERFAEVTESFWTTLQKTDVFLQEHNELGLSTYDTHSDQSGVRFSSRLRPILNMAPGTPAWSFNADTHILGWLENQGIAYDVVTDEDLHREGTSALAPYRAVMTGTHPEYYTTPMMEGLHDYIAGAGRLIYMGGNGFIWRCAMSDAVPGVVELRRAEDGIRYRDEEPGEYDLELTGEYGGLWRRLGLPPQALVGVGTIACGFDSSGYFKRTDQSLDPRAAFIFDGIARDEVIGDFGFLGGGASGSEIDATDPLMGTPAHALVIARSEGHSENTLICPDEIGFHYPAMDGVQNPLIRADMTFFETPGGGAVFSASSITWAASLAHRRYDNNVSRLTGNVVRRFLEDAPFAPPTAPAPAR